MNNSTVARIFHSAGNSTTATSDSTLYLIIKIFGVILTSIFCLLGTFGNCIAIVVLLKVMSKGRQCPLFLILVALAASDGLLLILNCVMNVLSIGYDYTYWNFMLPMFLVNGRIITILWPISLATQMTSIYLTVLVSYERWLAVCHPFRANNRYSTKKISFIIMVIVVFSFIYNVPHWWEYNSVEANIINPHICLYGPLWMLCNQEQTQTVLSQISPSIMAQDKASWTEKQQTFYINLVNSTCQPTVIGYEKSKVGNNYLYRYVYSSAMYAIFMFILPVMLITALNIALVRTLKQSRQQWLNMSRSQRKEVKLSSVPLAIVALFYIFGMPALVTNFVDSFNIDLQGSDLVEFQVFLVISNFLVILNSAINFIIYCCLGGKFRNTFLEIFCCNKLNNDNQKSQNHSTINRPSPNNIEMNNIPPPHCFHNSHKLEALRSSSSSSSEKVSLLSNKNLSPGDTETII